MKGKLVRALYYIYSVFPIFFVVNFVRYFGKEISPYAHIFSTAISPSAKVLGTAILENSQIGDHTSISGDLLGFSRTHIRNTVIGKHCSIGPNLITLPQDHIYTNASTYSFMQDDSDVRTRKIIIKNDVWIASNVIILGGVTIGNGAVIGAGSIVTKNIPPYSIAVGNPARVIKKRFSNASIKKLEMIRWWDSKKYTQLLIKSNNLKTLIHAYEKKQKKSHR